MSRRRDETGRRGIADVCETWRGVINAECQCTYHCTSCNRYGEHGECCSCCRAEVRRP